MFFYPTGGYHLAEHQYNALVEAARDVHDRGFFLTVTEYGKNFLSLGEHYWCEFPSFLDYKKLVLSLPPLENALYSKEGRWGMLLSHEDHAIVGGDAVFVSKLKDLYPRWKSDLAELQEIWRGNPHGDWLVSVLDWRHSPVNPGTATNFKENLTDANRQE
jgi:hypothetical protein